MEEFRQIGKSFVADVNKYREDEIILCKFPAIANKINVKFVRNYLLIIEIFVKINIERMLRTISLLRKFR